MKDLIIPLFRFPPGEVKLRLKVKDWLDMLVRVKSLTGPGG